jgi:hypothetical protein
MAKVKIPDPIPIDWKMRNLSTAKVTVRELEDGRFEQTIEHAPLPGIKPEMMLWMLENMGRVLEWRDHRAITYRYWHPTDHILFERIGPFRPGCRFHIIEAFQGEARVPAAMDLRRDEARSYRLSIGAPQARPADHELG